MRKLEIADAEVMQLAIREEINRSEEARYNHRLHGLLLVSTGRSCNEVGALFGEAATTVQRWVRRFEESGFEGLRDGERQGRPRSLDERSWRRIEADLRKSPVVDEEWPAVPASLIYTGQGRLPMKTRAFIDFAVGRLRDRLSTLDAKGARVPPLPPAPVHRRR